MDQFTITELQIMMMLFEGKKVPRNLETARAVLRGKIKRQLDKAVAEIEV